MSGRLEEIPGDQELQLLRKPYRRNTERAGRFETLGSEGREGTITAIGCRITSGGDTSGTSNTKYIACSQSILGIRCNIESKTSLPSYELVNVLLMTLS